MQFRPLIATGTILGIGMGGFVDGILFHQILQLHNMLSGIIPTVDIVSLEVNMVWDGLFHALTWTMTALGIALLWFVAKKDNVIKSNRIFGGSLFLGWGIFNLIEGMIDHNILGVHHVVEKFGLSIYDYAFLGSGVFFMVFGVYLIKKEFKQLAFRT